MMADYPDSAKEIVIVGRSNAGKSSFINALFSHKIAYVGKTPGKTRILNFFDYNGEFTIVDVPGYGFAKLSDKQIVAFGEMMDEYFAKRDCLRLMVMIVDIRHKPTTDDLDMINFARYKHLKTIVVASKSDKISNNQKIRQLKLIADTLNVRNEDIVAFSSIKPDNITPVLNLIRTKIA